MKIKNEKLKEMEESMRLATRVILASYADIRKADESYLVKKSPYLKIILEIKKALENCPTLQEYMVELDKEFSTKVPDVEKRDL